MTDAITAIANQRSPAPCAACLYKAYKETDCAGIPKDTINTITANALPGLVFAKGLGTEYQSGLAVFSMVMIKANVPMFMIT